MSEFFIFLEEEILEEVYSWLRSNFPDINFRYEKKEVIYRFMDTWNEEEEKLDPPAHEALLSFLVEQ